MSRADRKAQCMNDFTEIFKYDGLQNIRTVVEQVDAGQVGEQLAIIEKALSRQDPGDDRAALVQRREDCRKRFGAVVEDNVDIWFVAKDAAEVLEFRDASRAVRYHVEAGDRSKLPVLDANGRRQLTTVLSLPGFIALILGSRTPEARRFRCRVVDVVVPLS